MTHFSLGYEIKHWKQETTIRKHCKLECYQDSSIIGMKTKYLLSRLVAEKQLVWKQNLSSGGKIKCFDPRQQHFCLFSSSKIYFHKICFLHC